MNQDRRLAVLIDAENVSFRYIGFVMAELGKYGTPTIKRIFGNWTSPNLTGWKDVLNEFAITPIQQFEYTKGKNSTDSALIIDAMDILYAKNVDGFCIISSDSDYTRLATRLRESGMFVIGMGERKTPKPFISACEKFTYLEVLENASERQQPLPSSSALGSTKKEPPKPKESAKLAELTQLIISVVNDAADDDGWAFMSEVKQQLVRRQPDFDERNYGFSKMTPLIASLGAFEITTRVNPANPAIKLVYIRQKTEK